MSMLFIIVDNEGELSYCNNRWNHEGQWKEGFNCDFIMNKEMISELIGRNFNETFKSSNIKLNDILNKVEERLLNGEGVYDVFDEIYKTTNKEFFIVKKYEFYNILNIKTKQLISPNMWSDSFIYYDKEWNLFTNKKYKKFNFVNTKGELISKEYFDNAFDFRNGVAAIQLNGKWNWINTKGEYLFPNQWFDSVGGFNNGFGRVKLNDKWNFINTEGEIISPNQWFDNAYSFYHNFAIVQLNGKRNFINTKGEYLRPDQWFDYVRYFSNGFSAVVLNGKYYFINTEGEYLFSDKWFDGVSDFEDGFAAVKLNGKRNIINKNGNIILEEWSENKIEISNKIFELRYLKS